jgi:hypothetical protein
MKLKITQKGTHILPVSEWNNDIPSPCENVAEALIDLEYHIGELVKSGGAMGDSLVVRDTKSSLFGLVSALNAATRQGWKLELE